MRLSLTWSRNRRLGTAELRREILEYLQEVTSHSPIPDETNRFSVNGNSET